MPNNNSKPLILGGGYGSPYSLKMRSVLRYRQIPFTWVPRDSKWDTIGAAPVKLIPVIAFPDADGNYTDVQIDSSPLIARLETMHSARSLVPTDPVVAFLDYLIEVLPLPLVLQRCHRQGRLVVTARHGSADV